MDIASKEGYNDIMVQLSGLTNCNLQESHCSCAELKRILFREKEIFKTDDLKTLKMSSKEGENIAIQLEERIRRTSESQMIEANHTVWHERLELARAEVVAHCESRIAEVEEQCKMKVARIERQCNERLLAARQMLMDVSRVPSAPSLSRKPLFSSSSTISGNFRAGSL